MEPGPLTPLVVPPPADASTGAPLALLRGTEYCAGMTDDQLAAVAELMRPVSYAPGEFIFKQGTPPDGLYLLEQGEALFWTRIGDARKDIVRFQPGNTLCGSALFETHGRIASCEATQRSRVWLLDIGAYRGLRARGHEAIFRLMSVSASHLSLNFCRSMEYYRQLLGIVSSGAPAQLSPPVQQPITDAQDALLKVVPFIKALDAQRFAKLREAGRWREVKRGDRLAIEGGPPGNLHLVVRGALEASVTTAAGKVRFGMLGPGRWSGLEAFYSRGPQPSDVIAKENALLVSFDRESFDSLYDARHPLALDLIEQAMGAIAIQFDRDQRALHQMLLDRGHQASISADEITGRSPLAST